MSASPPPRVSFVVPLYNTGNALPSLIEAFRSLTIPGGFELILINDGSPDGTGNRVPPLLASLPFPVTFVDLARNFGEHAAVMEGFRHCRGTSIINLDDDLQNPLREAVRLLEHLESSGAEVVYARYARKEHHPLRNLGSRFNDWAATLVLGKPPGLYLCSFRAHRHDLIQRVLRYEGPYPYIDGLILGSTDRIETLEVAHAARTDGQSGYTLRRLVRLWMNMFFNFSIMPLRVASILGLLLCACGAIGVLIVIAEWFSTSRTVPGWASLITAISLFSGCQLLMLGVIGEYLGRTYLTVSSKPQSLVRSITSHQPENHSPPAVQT
jgi:undecaprenyl-phosphate 4-deoxy-4-formamido-L-arabinose transferase